MNELEQARLEISKIDEEMAKLYEQRMIACRRVAAYKKETGLAIRDAERENALIEKNGALIENDDVRDSYVLYLKNMFELSCTYQERLNNGMKISYAGERGSFAHIAAKRMYPHAQLIAYPDFIKAHRAVETGEVDCAVLPVENSSAGEVSTVADLIFSGGLYMNRVMDVPVAHCLLAPEGSSLSDIKTVVSHPQALAQCANYIRAREYKTEAYSNTALAAQFVKESGRKDLAAIASADSAEIFGLTILDSTINDIKTNTTRFASFSRIRSEEKSGGENKSFVLVFTVRNEAGALAQALDIVGAHGYNMLSLRSRPMKELQWHYYFYIEAEGEVNNENGRNMLQELSAICEKLRLAGSYCTEKPTI